MGVDRAILDLIYEYNGFGIVFYVMITILISGILSAFVGILKQLQGKSISIKTYVMISMGSTLLMTISIWGIRLGGGALEMIDGVTNNSLSYDASRIAASAVSGMGFIGAGAIIKDKFTVKGLSTASTLWICVAIGLACGAGFIIEGIAFTIIVIIFLVLLEKFSGYMGFISPDVIVEFERGRPVLETAKEIADKSGIAIKKTDIIKMDDKYMTAKICFATNTIKGNLVYLADRIKDHPGVVSVTVLTKEDKRERYKASKKEGK